MEKLNVLKNLLQIKNNELDDLLQFYLDSAENIICDIRNSTSVEPQYEFTQVKMAVEMYNKMGAEGQVSHNENGVSRNYENSGISKSLLDEVTPVIKTPFSKKRS